MYVLTVARQTEGIPLSQWLRLDPWEFVNPVNHWIDRGNEQVHLDGLYQTSARGTGSFGLGAACTTEFEYSRRHKWNSLCLGKF